MNTWTLTVLIHSIQLRETDGRINKTFSYDTTSFPAAEVKYQYEILSKENDFWNGNNVQNLDLRYHRQPPGCEDYQKIP
jgi:hypothetical protein